MKTYHPVRFHTFGSCVRSEFVDGDELLKQPSILYEIHLWKPNLTVSDLILMQFSLSFNSDQLSNNIIFSSFSNFNNL